MSLVWYGSMASASPEEEEDNSIEVRKLSQWQTESSAFLLMQSASPISATALRRQNSSGNLEHPEELPVEGRKLLPRETPFGEFLGSVWRAQNASWRGRLGMYRGLSREVYQRRGKRRLNPRMPNPTPKGRAIPLRIGRNRNESRCAQLRTGRLPTRDQNSMNSS